MNKQNIIKWLVGVSILVIIVTIVIVKYGLAHRQVIM
jgi:hypothetical protein